ncbi:hypothetical protein IE53DRAFT_367337 [Violaceomyces palustris]|uniref:Uncharacterized protein n=1 Tax=Violaceomyces palustris TaxID=1673888 RepID=A0ACD0P2Q1_9BASI|nr:hypothetical protein IE53DRAFT_367337 [Violaceomyces palustris]
MSASASSSTSSASSSLATIPATASTTEANPVKTIFNSNLGPNQACDSCRQRRVRCDGVKPTCSVCASAYFKKVNKILNPKPRSKKNASTLEMPQGINLRVPPPCSYTGRNAGKVSTKKARNSSTDSTASISVTQQSEDPSELGLIAFPGKSTKAVSQDDVGSSMNWSDLDILPNRGQPSFGPPNPQTELGIDATKALTSPLFASIVEINQIGMPSPRFDFNSIDAEWQSLVNTLSQEIPQSPQFPLPHLSLALPGAEDATLDQYMRPSSASWPNAGLDSSVGNVQSDGRPHLCKQVDSTASLAKWSSSVIQSSNNPFSPWPIDLPSPPDLVRLVEVAFEAYPRFFFFHQARFLASMKMGPTHPNYPHACLLHMVLCFAYTATEPDKSDKARLIEMNKSRSKELAYPTLAAYHADRSRDIVAKISWNPKNLYSAVQANALECRFRFMMADFTGAWTSAGTTCRLIVPLGLHQILASPADPRDVFMVDPPVWAKPDPDRGRGIMGRNKEDWVAEEEWRRTLWAVYANEKMSVAASGMSSCFSDEDILTELPGHHVAFVNEDMSLDPGFPKQTLSSEDLYTSKPVDICDLLLKATILLGRCGKFRSLPFTHRSDTRQKELQEDIDTFASCHGLRSRYVLPKQNMSLEEICETYDLIAIKLVVCTCQMTLNRGGVWEWMKEDERRKCRESADEVVEVIRTITSSAWFDLTRLPAFVPHAVSLTGKTLGQYLLHSRKTLSKYESDPARLLDSDIPKIQELRKIICKIEVDVRACIDLLVAYSRKWKVGAFHADNLKRLLE